MNVNAHSRATPIAWAAAARLGCKQIMCETLTLDFDGEVKDVKVDVYPILSVQSDDAHIESDSSRIEHHKRTAKP